MLRAPIWITSATSSTASRSLISISSVTIGRPDCSRGSASSLSPPAPGPRDGNAVRARACCVEDLVPRLDGARSGDHREVLAADLAPRDLQHRSLTVADLQR